MLYMLVLSTAWFFYLFEDTGNEDILAGPHNIIQTSSVSETTPVPYLIRAIVCTPFCRGLSHNALQKQPVSVLYLEISRKLKKWSVVLLTTMQF